MKISYKNIIFSKQEKYVVAREDLDNLVENLRKLSRDHKVTLLIFSYRRLISWIDWQSEKHEVPILIVKPRETYSMCPRRGSRLVENGCSVLKCPRRGFEAYRDRVAVLNIERKGMFRIGVLRPPSLPCR